MNTTVTSLVQAAFARTLWPQDESSSILVDLLMDTLGPNNISTPTKVRFEAVISLRRVVRLFETNHISHPVLCRLLPLLTSLKQLREAVNHCFRITSNFSNSLPSPSSPSSPSSTPQPLPLIVPATLDELYKQRKTYDSISTAWNQILSKGTDTQNHVQLFTYTTNNQTINPFQKVVVEFVQHETTAIQEEYTQMSKILKIMWSIIVQTHQCTDPERLQTAIACAHECSDQLKHVKYPPWDIVLHLGIQRLKEATTMLDGLRTNVKGVVDIGTINKALEISNQQRLGGKHVEQWKRMANELELAKHATDDLSTLWTCHRKEKTQQRPVDVLTDRLSRSSRLRNFVGLSNHENTLYFCDTMLSSPGLNVTQRLEALHLHQCENK